jgi:hypothetical protein
MADGDLGCGAARPVAESDNEAVRRTERWFWVFIPLQISAADIHALGKQLESLGWDRQASGDRLLARSYSAGPV